MAEQEDNVEQFVLPVSAGDKLRAARQTKGLSLAQVSAETRISQRHLAQIEAGDFAALPARTYAVGFSRTYAKLLGLDDDEIVQEVRAEMSMIAPVDNRASSFEPGDPARVPSARLAWFSAFAALLLFVGGSIFLWRSFVSPGASLPWLTAEEEAVAQAEPAPAITPEPSPTPAGDVVFTALEEGIWVKFYDGDGKQLMQKQMAKGETYTVPATATGPQLWTGRPDALSVTIGGQEVARISEREGIVRDVPVTAEALLARPSQQAQTSSPTI